MSPYETLIRIPQRVRHNSLVDPDKILYALETNPLPEKQRSATSYASVTPSTKACPIISRAMRSFAWRWCKQLHRTVSKSGSTRSESATFTIQTKHSNQGHRTSCSSRSWGPLHMECRACAQPPRNAPSALIFKCSQQNQRSGAAAKA